MSIATVSHAQLFSWPPTILAARTLTTDENVPVTVQFDDLTVLDLDDVYPNGFTITLYEGNNYSFSGTTITPLKNFVGTLTVPVTVNDGENESASHNISVNVKEVPNVKPVIEDQKDLTITEGSSIIVELEDLIVTDPDNDYPEDFTLKLSSGANYQLNENEVIPDAGFIGTLTVKTTVNDGEDESDNFDLQIKVEEIPNAVPLITGQKTLSTRQTIPITIKLQDLIVTDADNTYPTGFTMTLYSGANYGFTGLTVTPDASFSGDLKIPVTVNDGKDESLKYTLTVTVVPNDVPVVTGQQELKTLQNNSIVIKPENLVVTDSDNSYPADFTLKLYDGSNYTLSGLTVIPAASFIGDLKVPVTVNDGISESEKFTLTITVEEPANTAPVITGQDVLSIDEDKTITLVLDNLQVTDPDDSYPTGFTLILLPPMASSKYTVNGSIVTPASNFNGDLLVRVKVNDGRDDSNIYEVKIKVNAVNDVPAITAQKTLSTYLNTPITLTTNDLTIEDPDDTQFTLKVNPGLFYTVEGTTITPLLTIPGDLNVSVQAFDGDAYSLVKNVLIKVINTPNVAPTITGQKPTPLVTVQNTSIEIKLDNLIITDPDDKDQTNFKLKVSGGSNYTVVNGTFIRPANNFIGQLSVPVVVNDGTDDSQPFSFQINVIPPSAKPQIVGQSQLAINEDTNLAIQLADLTVTDADDTYPNGFTLQILSGPGYTVQGTTIIPTKDLNGFLSVNVTVTDDDNKVSDPYGLTILINPVNDSPVITLFETDDISYEPGEDPVPLTAVFTIEDVDNAYLSFAEVGIKSTTYTKGYDHLIFSNTSNIRGFFDLDSGKLSLIGYAPIQEYQDAIRSISYEYDLTQDETGVGQALPGNKIVYMSVNDGQLESEVKYRNIIMETDVTVEIPNAFTPNGDPDNDTWQVIAKTNAQQCENAEVKVYNRHGQLLFHSIGIEKQWDGRYNGELLPTDTYFYTVDLNLSYTKKTYTGVVALIR